VGRRGVGDKRVQGFWHLKKNLKKYRDAILMGAEAIEDFFRFIFARIIRRGIKEIKRHRDKTPCNLTLKMALKLIADS
jgi:hypothetical protein